MHGACVGSVHNQSELQITPWRGARTSTLWKAYIKLTVAACVRLCEVCDLSRWRMSFSHRRVVHRADAPSSRPKLLCTLWCLLVSQTSLCVACFADCLPCLCGCSLFRDRRISGHLQLQQRRSRKDGDHPLERPGARMKYEDNFWEDRFRRRLHQWVFFNLISSFAKISPGLSRSTRTFAW